MLGKYDSGNFELNESYREIRNYLNINKNIKTILISSAEMDEGKTTVTCNISRCFSELQDTKVIVIDCDFRKRGVSKYFQVENTYGVADIVFGYKDIAECIRKSGDLDIITCGGSPANTSIVLNSQNMKDFILALREQYDYVFIDSPPIARLNDACIITQYVDGTVLVNASKAIDGKLAKITMDKLNKVGSNVIGVILNKYKQERSRYYGYYGYSEYAGDRGGAKKKKKTKRKNK